MIKKNKFEVLKGIGLTLVVATANTSIYMYMPSYLATYFKIPTSKIFMFNILGLVLYVLSIFTMGYIAGKYKLNEKKLYLVCNSILCIAVIPCYLIIFTSNHLLLFLNYLIFGISMGGATAVFCLIMCKMFPGTVRFTGVSIAYNICFAIFGGLTPLINTILIQKLSMVIAPSIYIAVTAVIGLLTVSKIEYSEKQKN